MRNWRWNCKMQKSKRGRRGSGKQNPKKNIKQPTFPQPQSMFFTYCVQMNAIMTTNPSLLLFVAKLINSCIESLSLVVCNMLYSCSVFGLKRTQRMVLLGSEIKKHVHTQTVTAVMERGPLWPISNTWINSHVPSCNLLHTTQTSRPHSHAHSLMCVVMWLLPPSLKLLQMVMCMKKHEYSTHYCTRFIRTQVDNSVCNLLNMGIP